jgi:hypothetical protein
MQQDAQIQNPNTDQNRHILSQLVRHVSRKII